MRRAIQGDESINVKFFFCNPTTWRHENRSFLLVLLALGPALGPDFLISPELFLTSRNFVDSPETWVAALQAAWKEG